MFSSAEEDRAARAELRSASYNIRAIQRAQPLLFAREQEAMYGGMQIREGSGKLTGSQGLSERSRRRLSCALRVKFPKYAPQLLESDQVKEEKGGEKMDCCESERSDVSHK